MSQTPTSKRRPIPGLRQACEAGIYQHVFSNADREVGGMLVGHISTDGAMPTVTGAIPAMAADERRAALTITQDAWEYVHGILDSHFPDQRIVGWYHSHPEFGVFLSGHDLFIHRSFFSSRSQIALVIDPIGREEGVFAWRESANDVDLYMKGSTPDGWQALANDGRVLEPRRATEAALAGDGPRTMRPYLVALAALVAFAGAFAISFMLTRSDSSSHKKPASSVTTAKSPKQGSSHGPRTVLTPTVTTPSPTTGTGG